MKTTTLSSKHSINHTSCPLVLLLIALALACFTLSPQARATCEEGCLTNGNTVLGDDALLNSTGANNTATGSGALSANTIGFANTATGMDALSSNTTGTANTATGVQALQDNTTGAANTATGFFALIRNKSGHSNTAVGVNALFGNNRGQHNTAVGFDALHNNQAGSFNIALGSNAGSKLSSGDGNIDIGNEGRPDEASTIRLGTTGNQTATFIAGISGATVAGGVGVIIDTNGQLGTVVSSARFKEEIKPMESASEAILALNPVTFRYKHELDPAGIPQFGLVAEDVEKVNPDLVARDGRGKPYSVRYEAVNAMLLNEFLKEHRTVQELKSIVAKQETTAAKQQKQIDALTLGLQKVSAQLALSKAERQTVQNSQ
jgi:endosialidase-like protein